jgi:hypothetical protein
VLNDVPISQLRNHAGRLDLSMHGLYIVLVTCSSWGTDASPPFFTRFNLTPRSAEPGTMTTHPLRGGEAMTTVGLHNELSIILHSDTYTLSGPLRLRNDSPPF